MRKGTTVGEGVGAIDDGRSLVWLDGPASLENMLKEVWKIEGIGVVGRVVLCARKGYVAIVRVGIWPSIRHDLEAVNIGLRSWGKHNIPGVKDHPTTIHRLPECECYLAGGAPGPNDVGWSAARSLSVRPEPLRRFSLSQNRR